MKKLGLLVLAVLMISLSSCGGDNAKKTEEAAKDAAEKVEQKAAEVKEEVKEEAAKVEEKAAEVKEEAKEAADVDGKTLFMENGCVACHNADKKTVGPAIKEIAAGYASKKDNLIKFLKGEGKAIIDPAQFAVMQPNLATTKKMNDAQVGAIADYMLSFK
jgi:cytochrome c